jgi:hypothetical protein
MLSGIHFLLTYACNFECDHCFVYSAPGAKGTFTVAQIRRALGEVAGLESIEQVCFEGGEPTLYYPLMLEGVRLAREMGFTVGLVTNAYWAATEEDAALWLEPLVEAGLSRVTTSDDELHYGEGAGVRAERVLAAAEKLGVGAGVIATGKPVVERQGSGETPVVAGGVMFRGRAADKLSTELWGELPRRPAEEFRECPHENLRDPGRVHVDAYGNVHLCQGLCMGNMWRTPLASLAREYRAERHPICGPLVAGGPAALAAEFGGAEEAGYVDACHLCYVVRRALVDRFPDRFPEYLAPGQVYGL